MIRFVTILFISFSIGAILRTFWGEAPLRGRRLAAFAAIYLPIAYAALYALDIMGVLPR